MRMLSHQELEAIAREQGLPETSLDVAAAVAQAESGGGEARGHPTLDPQAHKDSNGRWSIGLWQINSLNGPPPGAGRGDLTNDQLATASLNAKAMAQISANGTNWKPWGAFNNGSFRKFLTKGAGMEMTTKAQWGAKPPKNKLGVISGSVSELFLHHTVTESGPPERQHEIMRSVQATAFTKGFSDISYSFLVFPTGQIYEGRGWGVVGAHTLGHNAIAYAICLVGHYGHEPMTDAQVEAARQIVAEGQRRGFITNKPTIQGHREVYATECPGDNAFARLDDIRRAIAGGQSGGGGTPGAGPTFPGVILKKGAKGNDVCRVQERLRVLGFAIDRVDGCPFGPQTETAVIAFQRQRGLGVDGKVGKNTWDALFA